MVFAAMMIMAGCGSSKDTTTITEAETPTAPTVEVASGDAEDVEVPQDEEYVDANGWSVRYDPSVIALNAGGPVSTFVYTGDCAGTCMVMTT